MFIYASFWHGGGDRRNDHLYLTACPSDARHAAHDRGDHHPPRRARRALLLIWYGYLNLSPGFGSFRLPSSTPIASLYAAIPLAALIALFTIEQLVNGIRNGFDHPSRRSIGSLLARSTPTSDEGRT
jgi:hypothetical protein